METLDDMFFMKKALREAQQALEDNEIPIGAIVVVDGKIIARGHNRTEKLCDVTAHAEMQAITSASNYLGAKYLHDATLYVTLEPCQMCTGALYWSQIGRLVYGASDKKRGGLSHGMELHPKTQQSNGILEQECRHILQSFFELKRRQK